MNRNALRNVVRHRSDRAVANPDLIAGSVCDSVASVYACAQLPYCWNVWLAASFETSPYRNVSCIFRAVHVDNTSIQILLAYNMLNARARNSWGKYSIWYKINKHYTVTIQCICDFNHERSVSFVFESGVFGFCGYVGLYRAIMHKCALEN